MVWQRGRVPHFEFCPFPILTVFTANGIFILYFYDKGWTMIELQLRTVPEVCCSLAISGAEQDRLVAMLKAIANPVRLEILKFLVTHPGCITGDIVDYLPIAQATVSQHLKVLRDAGWIDGAINGPAVCYCLNSSNIAWFKSKIGEIF
jgi:ArsR family transcriptional regulator, arsenate/arsenite/antimonite-responsive transcriptional repressor